MLNNEFANLIAILLGSVAVIGAKKSFL